MEGAALKIEGVTGAKVDQRRNQATITYEPATTQPETIARIITEKTGFRAEVVQPR